MTTTDEQVKTLRMLADLIEQGVAQTDKFELKSCANMVSDRPMFSTRSVFLDLECTVPEPSAGVVE